MKTGAVIGSHTIRGRVVQDQVKMLEQEGLAPGRFIWIHTQAEPDFGLHLEMARRGVWIEYDDIGGSAAADEERLRQVIAVLEAGLGARLLLSQDRGWYDPAQPGGGQQKPYAALVEEFLPRLSRAGVDDRMLRTLTRGNPFAAFAIEEGAAE